MELKKSEILRKIRDVDGYTKDLTPDGDGITYAYGELKPGSTILLDDDLCLWLSKSLENTGVGCDE